MLEFEILARGLYGPAQLLITYDPTLRMPLTPSLQKWIDSVWQEKLALARAEGFPLFDAQLFRLVSAEAASNGTLRIVLSDTSYKEYTGTREPAFSRGRNRRELGNALAVCAVVETSDDYILYERRQRVAVHAGRYHVIAGFFERQRDVNAQGWPDPFAAMYREIREETGIQAADIAEQYCLGSVYDLTSPHAELCFLTRLNISLAQVRTRVPEDAEIQQLLALQVTAANLRAFVLHNHGNISATGEPDLLMYGGVRFGEEWWDGMMKELTS